MNELDYDEDKDYSDDIEATYALSEDEGGTYYFKWYGGFPTKVYVDGEGEA